MDILTRWHRMSGDTSVWVPGTDHAGIATQMMVERQLAAEGTTTRQQMGREAFTERVWAWKQLYGSAITDQMKRLGTSVDWSREYFTMDDRLSVAVKEAFVRLYEQGLIYRGAYIVNWDPQIQTAVSDLEVDSEERPGHLFYIRYDLADGGALSPHSPGSITIATTRPETLLGDTAVVVNPTDERYTHLVGKTLKLPLTNREIPILADDWAQPEFGTGAVKVTPAHDPNDFAIGQRHNLPSPLIMDTQARISLAGSPYNGLDRFEARKRIVADLDAAGHLVKIADHTLTLPISQRTGAIVEPRLSMQWFLAVNKQPREPGTKDEPREPGINEPREPGIKDAPRDPGLEGGFSPLFTPSTNPGFSPGATPRNSIAANAIAAVREGHITFTPDNNTKIYNQWMENIYDWCISRQLWWGHRIPAWHCNACGCITVSREIATACSGCGITDIHQETDVLDTWFSSGLLPFTVFGWDGSNQLTPDLAAFYPTQQLVTGFDILFFWVARMIMLGTHFMLDVPMPDGTPRTLADAVPFRNVYIHALVRDADRQKISKTKGNVIDPIEVITKYGTDAVRFTLACPGLARHRHRLQRGPHRRLPRLLQQDLELRPLPPDEHRARPRSRLSRNPPQLCHLDRSEAKWRDPCIRPCPSRGRHPPRDPLDLLPPQHRLRRSQPLPRRLPLRRGRRLRLPVLLGRVLRLVPRARQAPPQLPVFPHGRRSLIRTRSSHGCQGRSRRGL